MPDSTIVVQPGATFNQTIQILTDDTGPTDPVPPSGPVEADEVVTVSMYPGTTVRNQEEKNNDTYSVRDWGANGLGADYTSQFTIAAKNAPARINIQGPEADNIARAHMARIFVPAGTYILSSLVDTGGREVTWVLDQGAVVTPVQFLNGKVVREGMRIIGSHHGTNDYSCTFTVRGNKPLEEGSEVLGIQTESDLYQYQDRDTVGVYIDNYAPPALADISSATYTLTSMTMSVALTPDQVKRLRVGMIIDTKHIPKCSGFITGWSPIGTSIIVEGWYQSNSTKMVPSSGVGAYINPFTKAWALNANVELSAQSHAWSATGFELGVLNNKTPSPSGYGSVWGMDVAQLGMKGDMAYIARGPWQYGFFSQNQDYGFFYRGNGQGLVIQNNFGGTQFQVLPNGSLELGNPLSTQQMSIDFHSSGVNRDYDASIRCVSGNSSILGSLSFTADTAYFAAEVRPMGDGVRALGSPAHRWTSLYAMNGAIVTSDGREKQEIRELSESERNVARRLKMLIRAFKYNASVEEKGSKARIHIGVIAQDVIEAFQLEGLNASNYALFCYDKTDDGYRLGIRYDELLAFIIAVS